MSDKTILAARAGGKVHKVRGYRGHFVTLCGLDIQDGDLLIQREEVTCQFCKHTSDAGPTVGGKQIL